MFYSHQATVPAISYCVSGWLMLDRSIVNGERAERGAFTPVVCLGEGGWSGYQPRQTATEALESRAQFG
jgi:hypothetical protein